MFVALRAAAGPAGRRGRRVGWLVAVLVLASRRPEGDLVVPGPVAGYVWLLGGTAARRCLRRAALRFRGAGAGR